MQREIKQTWHFNQSPQEVWEYLTRPDLLEQWLGKTDFQPIVGQKFRFISPYGNHCYCEVLEVRPFTQLSYSWQKNSSKDDKPFLSKVSWTLVPNKRGTDLQLVHDDFAWQEDVEAHNNGWNACQKQIEELINQTNNATTNA
jgi:uncharacterized protein YndB with AHSA1/START domain